MDIATKKFQSLFHLAFAKNDEQIRRYQPEIPFINLDETPNLPAEYTRVSMVV